MKRARASSCKSKKSVEPKNSKRQKVDKSISKSKSASKTKSASKDDFIKKKVKLNYQQLVKGKAVGRYIGQPDKGDVADKHALYEVDMHNARKMKIEPHLETVGFQLRHNPTKVKDFNNEKEIKDKYYKEIEALLYKSLGAKKVFIFDHTVRNTNVSNLNNLGKNEAAASVIRVHCDYTAESAPRRFKQLSQKESYTGFKVSANEVKKYM